MSAARPRKPPAADPATVTAELVAACAAGSLPRLLFLLPPERGEEEPWFAEQVLAAARAAARAAPALDYLDLDGGSPDFNPEALDAFLGSGSLFGSERALGFGRAGRALSRWPRLGEGLIRAAARADGPRWAVVQTDALAKPWKALLEPLAPGLVRQERFRRLYADPPPWNPDPDQSEAARFASAEAGRRGLRLLPGAAGVLVQMAGARPAELVQALEHLALLGSTQVDEDQVVAVVAHGAEGNAYEFAEALLAGDTAAVLRSLARLRQRGLRTWDGRRLAPPEAFGMLVSVLASERRRTAVLRRELDRGAEFASAAKAAGVAAAGPPAQRMQKRLQRCDAARLARIAGALRTAERMVKSGAAADPIHSLEWLAVKTMPAARRSGR